jgi:hypothetical protein
MLTRALLPMACIAPIIAQIVTGSITGDVTDPAAA